MNCNDFLSKVQQERSWWLESTAGLDCREKTKGRKRQHNKKHHRIVNIIPIDQ